MNNKVQLITYIDRLSADGIRGLTKLFAGPLAGVFGGAHLLPFYDAFDGADAGFDPRDHTAIDPRLGTWNDLAALGKCIELMADLIVNHISSESPQFKDYSQHGASSPYASMFLTYDKVFPHGATEAELLRIYRPRPGLPFTHAKLDCGQEKLLWTTFTPQQIDIDVTHPQSKAYLDSILARFHNAGIRAIRMDAVGYAIKKAGTSCFMIDDTFDFITELTERAHALGIEVLVEVHSYFKRQVEIARKVDWVYDFALPPLILHTLYSADVTALMRWLAVRPGNAINVLDTHDGIGIIDVGADETGNPGLLQPSQIDSLVETIHARSHGESLQATGAAANNLDLYQVNCTYFDALGKDEALYLIARALQLFIPGIPQIYYMGLLGGTNDMALLARSRIGRDINRHYYSEQEVASALRRPMVKKLIELIRLRNSHPAFNGKCAIESDAAHALSIRWETEADAITLRVDLTAPKASIEYTSQPAHTRTIVLISPEQ
jgi:sucrose phosphorylase